MIDDLTRKKIIDFVFIKPRTINDISKLIDKNWRTASRYIDIIVQETGALNVTTFREGTRGALKIVFFNNAENIRNTDIQEELLQRIKNGTRKQDFTPLDIFQYVPEISRKGVLENSTGKKRNANNDLINLFKSANNSILFFSGNLSWISLTREKVSILQELELLAKKGITIKIICKIDLTTMPKIYEIQQINKKLGREAIEVRHREQPIRGLIIDDKQIRFKETKNHQEYKSGELEKDILIFYDIYDVDWCDWLKKVFWHMFSKATPLSIRLKALEELKKL